MIGVSVLGATGSIGLSTLDVLARHPERFRIFALSGHRNLALMQQLCRQHRPSYAVMADKARAEALRQSLRDSDTQVLAGNEGLEYIAAHAEAQVVMAAIVGAAGLLPALAAVRAGKRVLLANKESLVVSGALFMEEARRHGAEILPIDSEHNAIFQCLPMRGALAACQTSKSDRLLAGEPGSEGLAALGVERILLTASGGPFRTWPQEALARVTPDQACTHPNWSMGRKISVDSATLMNKGLEVIEACWLFGARPDQIKVVVHPQSIIHSLVSYRDGSLLAQLGNPDMRTPIAHALAWPERMASGVQALDLCAIGRLEFEEPDTNRFPCLQLAFEAMRLGGSAPALLNAANEVAVEAFLEGRLDFPGIPRLIAGVLERMPCAPAQDLEALLALDVEARSLAQQMMG